MSSASHRWFGWLVLEICTLPATGPQFPRLSRADLTDPVPGSYRSASAPEGEARKDSSNSSNKRLMTEVSQPSCPEPGSAVETLLLELSYKNPYVSFTYLLHCYR